MSTLPALNYLSNAARTEGEEKVAFEDQLAGIKQIPGSGIAETTLTLAAGSVTPPGGGPGVFSIDTEAAAAQDDLSNIVQTNLPDGSLLLIRPANSARIITVLHNAGGVGQLSLRTSGAFTLGDTTHWLLLKRSGTIWIEVFRGPREGATGVSTKTANYTVVQTDRGKIIDCPSGTFTLTLPPASQAGIGFDLMIRNAGTGLVTLDGNASETVNGATTALLFPGGWVNLMCTGTAWLSSGSGSLLQPGVFPISRMGISGLTYQNNGGDAVNDLDIAAGECRDATNAENMVVSALTKQSDVAWAVGSGAGGLDTGAVGNNNYYIWLIKRLDTLVVDVLFSLSSTAPTMPTNYTVKRLIGWFKRVAGTIVAFTTYEIEGGGLELLWQSPTLDINLANTLTTARRTDALKVPLNLSVTASINVFISDSGGTNPVYLYCPDQADLPPSISVTPLASASTGVAIAESGFTMKVRTSATGTIAARAAVATIDQYSVVTLGFTWARRN